MKISVIERIKLTSELAKLVKQKNIEKNITVKLKISELIQEIRFKLGLIKITNNTPTATVSGLSNTDSLFNYNEDGVSKKTRQQRNNIAISLVEDILNGRIAINDLTLEQKQQLSLYSGSGGGLKSAEGLKGSAYEYYTPKAIASGMWDLLKESGFTGGVVLDPCAGTGIFSATAPKEGVLMQSVELDTISGTINKAIFNDDNHQVTVSPFETVAVSTDDESVDAVIANVPFGDNRGEYRYLDERYQDEGLDGYFILRSLDKLKAGKLAVFMSSSSVISGKGKEKLRKKIALKADFLGAYRMPNKLFDAAGADVVTDVMVFW